MKLLLFLLHIVTRLCTGDGLHLLSITGSNLDIDVNYVDVCIGPRIINCTLVLVNLEAFSGNIILPGGLILNKTREWTSGDFTSFEYKDHEVDVIFVQSNGRVVGGAGEFALEPCDNFDGCHAWKILEDLSEEDWDDVSGSRRRTTRRQSDTTTIKTISVMFYYTRQFIQHTSDVGLQIDYIIETTNQGFVNSGVPIRVETHCVEAAAMDDIWDTSSLIGKFQAYKHWGDIIFGYPNLRSSADVAALLVDDTRNCGVSVQDGVVLVVRKDCLSTYSFGHEVAHLLGATHEGGKYIEPNRSGYRTIMRYSASGHRTRVNYYSNPNVYLPETGTPTGSRSENNAQVITDNRFTKASIGNEQSSCVVNWPRWPNDFQW